MSGHFGARVVGEKAAAEATRKAEGGGNVFGSRVIGAITGDGPTNRAKRQSQFGVAVVVDAQQTNTKGEPADSVSIEELRNILAENPTQLDNMYEAELAREAGPREEALGIIYEVERGIKGQMRADVMAEIRSLMGQDEIDNDALANEIEVRAEQQKQQQARMEENKLLKDAPRLKALHDRNENLAAVKRQERTGGASGQSALTGTTTEQQEAAIAKDRGLKLPGQTDAVSASGSVPAKPDGPIHPESQAPGNRLGVPDQPEGTGDEGSSQDDTSPDDGAGESGEVTAETVESALKADLEDFLGDDIEKVKGTGANGNVVRDDLVKAAKRKLKAQAQS